MAPKKFGLIDEDRWVIPFWDIPIIRLISYRTSDPGLPTVDNPASCIKNLGDQTLNGIKNPPIDHTKHKSLFNRPIEESGVPFWTWDAAGKKD